MQSNQIMVVTAITGGKDSLIEEQETGGCEFIAYLDRECKSKTWQVKKAYDKFHDPRRNSRIHKLLIHRYTDTPISLWIDGNIGLKIPPQQLAEEWLQDYDLAVFKHNTRDCIYDEALVCAKHRLDDPELIIEQAVAYEKEEFAKHKGMGECGMILRRNNEKVRNFNNIWWAEYCRYSKRDQISFIYAADKAGIRINFLPTDIYIHPYLNYVYHLTPRTA